MKEIVSQKSIDELKKSQRNILLCIIISIVVAIGLMVPLFLFASRPYKLLFAIGLATITTLEANFILYMVVVSLVPLNNYKKLSMLSLSGNKFMTKGLITSINDKVTHYKGVAVFEIKVKDLEEENKDYIFLLEQSFKDIFIKDKSYTFITYQSLITAYEDLSR